MLLPNQSPAGIPSRNQRGLLRAAPRSTIHMRGCPNDRLPAPHRSSARPSLPASSVRPNRRRAGRWAGMGSYKEVVVQTLCESWVPTTQRDTEKLRAEPGSIFVCYFHFALDAFVSRVLRTTGDELYHKQIRSLIWSAVTCHRFILWPQKSADESAHSKFGLGKDKSVV